MLTELQPRRRGNSGADPAPGRLQPSRVPHHGVPARRAPRGRLQREHVGPARGRRGLRHRGCPRRPAHQRGRGPDHRHGRPRRQPAALLGKADPRHPRRDAENTWFGGVASRDNLDDAYSYCHPDVVAAISDTWQVTIIDPEWGAATPSSDPCSATSRAARTPRTGHRCMTTDASATNDRPQAERPPDGLLPAVPLGYGLLALVRAVPLDHARPLSCGASQVPRCRRAVPRIAPMSPACSAQTHNCAEISGGTGSPGPGCPAG